MSGDCFAPIDICGIQLNRLDCAGNLLGGPTDVVVMCEGVDITATPRLVAGVTDVTRNGAGGICAQRTTKARVEGYDIVWNICPKIDAEAWELLQVYNAILDEEGVTGGAVGDTVGIQDGAADNPCNCVQDPCQNPGVALLLWANNSDADGISTTKPYAVLALTRVQFDPPPVKIANVYTNVTLNGRTQPNPLYARGPGDIFPETGGLTGAFGLWDTIQPPPGGCKCELCGYASGADTPYAVPCVAPVVTDVAPISGTNAGGTSVVITGTGFTGATQVLFGLTPASSFGVDSPTQITAISPAHVNATVNVTVETNCGTSAISSDDEYQFTGGGG